MATPLFKFRLSDEERDAWQEQAERSDMNLSEWIRDCCNSRLGQVADVVPLDVYVKPVPAVVVKRGKDGRNYTGATISKFGRVMCEYIDDDGLFRWEYA